MVSKTKCTVSKSDVTNLFQTAGFKDASNVQAMNAGEYNAVFSAESGGKTYVIKIAPPVGLRVLTYERNLMASELFWYEQLRTNTPIPVPDVYFSNLNCTKNAYAYFIMEKLHGQTLNTIKMSKTERSQATAQLGTMAAQMHRIKNDGYGYIQTGLHKNWYDAIKAMTTALVADAAAAKKPSPHGQRLLAFIEQYQSVLTEVESRMVNFDMWPTNIIVSHLENGTKRYAWIDLERSFWGDAIADFVCLEPMVPFENKTCSITAYNTLADIPVRMTKNEKIRYAIAQGYLGLVMETERYVRYGKQHFGWWRNTLASKALFRQAFGLLSSLSS
jgi:aminoglycoside phosphotransferase (APT) family kinase protein